MLLFRFLVPFYKTLKHQFRILKVVRETDTVTSIYISGKNLTRFRIKPGQFILLRFLTKNFWLESHPFSLSKMPEGNSLRVSIKNVGDYTQKINSLKAGTYVYLEGPYGIFTKDASLHKKVLFLAGGIGITPIRSLLEEALYEKRDVILLYGNKFAKDIIFKKEIDNLVKQFPFKLNYVLSQEKKHGHEFGHIDSQKLVRLVNDIRMRDVYICGPKEMLLSMKQTVLKMGVDSSRIHIEEFVL